VKTFVVFNTIQNTECRIQQKKFLLCIVRNQFYQCAIFPAITSLLPVIFVFFCVATDIAADKAGKSFSYCYNWFGMEQGTTCLVRICHWFSLVSYWNITQQYILINVILYYSDPNKISVVCSIVKSLWNNVGRTVPLKDDYCTPTAAATSDGPSSSRPCVHIPHIEREMCLLLSNLLRKV